jgi:prepilin-type N-terminal cleavage/methylation domain-containing protein
MNKLFSRNPRSLRYQTQGYRTQGFTLPELLAAVLISLIVVAIATWGLTTVTTMIKRSEIEIERRIDISRAFDFMSYEIRAAKRVNHTATTIADGSTVSIADVVTNSGLSLSNLGSYGTLVLYLEVPISESTPAVCPAGGPNAGLAPPSPANFDQVIYDIRPNLGHWLGPRVINRYGRVPQLDGTINPCSSPIGSDTLVDAISGDDPAPLPTCNPPATLFGSGGFYACVNGALVNLHLRSKVINLETQDVDSSALSRPGSGNTLATPELTGTRQPGDLMNLSWTWTGSSGITFKLYQAIATGYPIEVYSGPNLNATINLGGSTGDRNCYTVVATLGTYTSDQSNQICESR